MSVIVDKQGILSTNYEETNNVFSSEEEIYQQMNLIKLEDLNILPLEEIRRKLNKKCDKMIVDEENNEIGEELNEMESNLVNNVVSKPEELSGSSRRNTYFMRLTYIPTGRTTNMSFRFIPRKTTSFEKLALSQLAK